LFRKKITIQQGSLFTPRIITVKIQERIYLGSALALYINFEKRLLK